MVEVMWMLLFLQIESEKQNGDEAGMLMGERALKYIGRGSLIRLRTLWHLETMSTRSLSNPSSRRQNAIVQMSIKEVTAFYQSYVYLI